jgi:hypothetical protein
MSKFILSFILLVGQSGFADLTDFEKELKKYESFETRESFLEVAGIPYRRIEFNNSFYFLRLNQTVDSQPQHRVICSDRSELVGSQPARIQAEVKVTKRSGLFIEALKISCAGNILPALQIGFTIPSSSRDFFTNKKFIVFPFLGFYGELN